MRETLRVSIIMSSVVMLALTLLCQWRPEWFVGAFTTVSLAIFIWKGLVVYSVGFVLAAGNSIGAYLGARFTVMKGNTWIRWSLAIVVVISAAQMIYSVL